MQEPDKVLEFKLTGDLDQVPAMSLDNNKVAQCKTKMMMIYNHLSHKERSLKIIQLLS